jgi:hypothetical protein
LKGLAASPPPLPTHERRDRRRLLAVQRTTQDTAGTGLGMRFMGDICSPPAHILPKGPLAQPDFCSFSKVGGRRLPIS